MPTIKHLIARGEASIFARQQSEAGTNDNLVNLLIAFMGLLFFALLLMAILILMRRNRRLKLANAAATGSEKPPSYDSVNGAKRHANHRRLTIQTGRSSILVVGKDGQPMLSNPQSPPHSPDNVPEIHITFPDETDEMGRPKSGRVVVVRVGDQSVGLEPVRDEQLPAYHEKETRVGGQSSGFYSIDIDEIGGLKEKDRTQFV